MAEQPIGVMNVHSSSSDETEFALSLQINDHDTNKNDVKVDESVSMRKKKKKKSVNILKVVLMLLRRRSCKPNNPAVVDVASKSMWNRLVAAIRPLHLQSDHSPPPLLPASEPAPPSLLCASLSVESFEDVNSSTSLDGMSRYTSAVNLQDLDQHDEDENNDKIHENIKEEDEMIDAKAEMFIAQFYAQMRLQRSESDIRYNEMIKRSIG